MAAHTLLVFTLSFCAYVYTGVECDSCSNMLECTMYNMQQVGRKVDGVQFNMTDVVNQLSQIRELQQQMTTEKEDLQQQMALQRQEVQNDLASQNEQIARQMEDVASQNEEIASQKSEMASQNAEIINQKEEIQNLTLKLESQLCENISKAERGELSSYVSVTAYATKVRDYNDGDHVIFDATVRNYGSAYFVNVSEFICPVNAYYMATISILTSGRRFMNGVIVLDNEELVIASAQDDATQASASQTMVTYCEAGQRIWVKCNINNTRMCGHETTPFSTFGVTLLSIGCVVMRLHPSQHLGSLF